MLDMFFRHSKIYIQCKEVFTIQKVRGDTENVPNVSNVSNVSTAAVAR